MPTSRSSRRLAVITAGDPSGIGPEIILKALTSKTLPKNITPLIIGDYKVFEKNAKILKLATLPAGSRKGGGFAVKEDCINFIDLNNVPQRKFRFGTLDKIYGQAAMEYLSCGVEIAKSVKNSFLVTAPINKEAIHKAGYKCAGHTEFLAYATETKQVTMMLVGEGLRVSLVTRHISLKSVAQSLTKENIIRTAENTYSALKNIFRIASPRIGIAGLNPHAGDGGVLGREERAIIEPAVKVLRRRIKGITGPHPADTLFYKAYRGDVDAVVCMYHDQGLVPLKMIAFDTGVNMTLGLPFVRTSPDHGTGFDIAGKGKANPSSMIEAIKLAARC
ncbi:4-hydroxythreonine-4-phosphate dehydrogenase PdxA [Candidatus Omnitrophota bacterium]